jgi:serine/threonine protein kinase
VVLKFRTSLNKVSWSIRDQPAYGDLLRHLEGFNAALENVLPSPTQEFLKTVLPATVCATTEDVVLPSFQYIPIGQAFLQSQLEWSRAVNGVSATPTGPQLEIKSMNPDEKSLRKDKTRYFAVKGTDQAVLIEWLPWLSISQDIDEREDRLRKVSGLLGGQRSPELRLLPCAGYLKQTDYGVGKQRFALVYELAFKPPRTRSLLDLLKTFSKVQLPPLEARTGLARLLCRSMLLYHSSNWIHHDFRSHNIVFMSGFSSVDANIPKEFEFEGINLSAPYTVGFGHARDETAESLMLADRKAAEKEMSEYKRYWSPNYLTSSKEKRTERSFQREHDIYSLGCVLLEIGVWKPLESYSWSSKYEDSHRAWHARLLREEGKLRALCGSRYAEAVMTCLRRSIANSSVAGDVQSLAFDVLLKLEEIVL